MAKASGGRDTPGKKQRAGRGPYYNAHACFPQGKWPTVRTHGRTMEGVLDLCNGAVSEKTPHPEAVFVLVLTQETRAGSFLQGFNSFPWYQSSSVCPSKVSGIQCIYTQ